MLNPRPKHLIERIEIPVLFTQGGSANCYFIPGSIPTLIDAGINTPAALQSLEEGLKKFGAGISDIRRIVLTHAHSDHAGAAGAIAELTGAAVFIHYRDKNWMLAGTDGAGEENELFISRFFQKAGVPEEICRERTSAMLNGFRKHSTSVPQIEWLKGGEVFSFDSFRMTVLHTPGHTAGSICLYDDTDGVLISGDCLIEGVIPYICTELNFPGDFLPDDCGLEQFEKSLDMLSQLPVRLVLPGHEAPFSGHKALIEWMKVYRSRRRKRILEVLGKRGKTGADPSGMSQFEVVKRIFSGPSIAGGALFMAISEVRGCLETMEKEGSVVSTLTNGKRLYSLRSIDHAKPVSIQYADKRDL